MLFGFNAVTEHNKTKKRGCARFKMKTAARSKCCQMKQNLTNVAQRAIIDMFTVGSIHDASNTR